MKKLHYVSIIVLLLISNLLTIFFYSDLKLEHTKKFKSNIKQAYLLEGETENWIFKGGNLFLGDYQELFVGSSIKYIGTKEINTDVIITTISIRDKSTDKLQSTRDTLNFIRDDFSATSLNGTLEIPLGSGLSSSDGKLNYHYDLTLNSKVYIDIEYKIDGELISERLKLNAIPIPLN